MRPRRVDQPGQAEDLHRRQGRHGAATQTGCLVKFQQGQADAITGDDTVLAGLAAQDPYAKVVGDPFTSEPYGIGAPAGSTDLVRVRQRRSRPDDLGRLLESLVQPLAGARARPGTNTAHPGLRTRIQTSMATAPTAREDARRP